MRVLSPHSGSNKGRLMGSLPSEADVDSVQVAIFTPVDQIDDNAPPARFGMDSTIVSEFQTWRWTAVKVDVPFHYISSPDKSISTSAELTVTFLIWSDTE
ncbi:hypothetical protein F4804DRAFT_302133 [Jackrogersella minutella]|nr:hypothetical protein F4804DRAFT_302133 [Jackrogersella minutella]